MVKNELNSYYNTAISFHRSGKLKEAKEIFHEILKANPNHLDSQVMLGKLFYQEGNFKDAAVWFEEASKQKHDHSTLALFFVKSLMKLERYEEVEKYLVKFSEKKALDPHLLFQYARAVKEMGMLLQSVEHYERLLKIEPNHKQALNNAGNLYQQLGLYTEAVSCYDKLITLDPSFAMGYANKASLMHKMGKNQEAKTNYIKAIEKDDQQSIFYYNLGQLYDIEFNDHQRAYETYTKGLELADETYGLALRYRQIISRQHLLDWSSRDKDCKNLDSILKDYLEKDLPFEIVPYDLSYSDIEPGLFKQVAVKYSKRLERQTKERFPNVQYMHTRKGRKIRVGYLSPNFKVHPGGTLVRNLFEYHNPREFEIHAFSLVEAHDFVNADIRESVDYYHDVSKYSVQETADLINRSGIDVLVSLAGFNHAMKMEVLALRPAPIQMMLIEYHQTTGASFIDYAFTDEFMVDDKLRNQFTENLITLPCSLLLNSDFPKGSHLKTERSDHGLPEDKFVFTSFNHPKKLDPFTVQAWMKILSEVEDSVLWVFDRGMTSVRERIRMQAGEYGISDIRILFTGLMDIEKHWERIKHADLFLDSFNYNGHVTAIEALRFGKPILTRYGKTHNNRICASLLHYAGLDQLISYSAKEYIEKAIFYGKNREELSTIGDELKNQNLLIFDSEMQIRYLEKAYKLSISNLKANKHPRDFTVSSSLEFDAFH